MLLPNNEHINNKERTNVTHLFEIFPKVLAKDGVIVVIRFSHHGKHGGHFLLLRCKLDRFPIVEHLDAMRFVLRWEENSIVLLKYCSTC